jgi:hypothetical protein
MLNLFLVVLVQEVVCVQKHAVAEQQDVVVAVKNIQQRVMGSLV